MGPLFIGPGHDKPVFPFRVAVFRLHSAHRVGKLPGEVAPRLSAHVNNSCEGALVNDCHTESVLNTLSLIYSMAL